MYTYDTVLRTICIPSYAWLQGGVPLSAPGVAYIFGPYPGHARPSSESIRRSWVRVWQAQFWSRFGKMGALESGRMLAGWGALASSQLSQPATHPPAHFPSWLPRFIQASHVVIRAQGRADCRRGKSVGPEVLAYRRVAKCWWSDLLGLSAAVFARVDRSGGHVGWSF